MPQATENVWECPATLVGGARDAGNFLTFGSPTTTFKASDWGLFPVGGWLWGLPEPFAFSGEDFQPPAVHPPLWIAAQLGLNDIPGPVGLMAIEHMAPDGAGCKVGELQASRIGLLVRENDFEAGHSAPLSGDTAD